MDQADQAFDALSIDEFCARHGFCRGSFYNLQKRGKAPKFFHVGARRFITREAAEVWRREREAAAEVEHKARLEARRAARGEPAVVDENRDAQSKPKPRARAASKTGGRS